MDSEVTANPVIPTNGKSKFRYRIDSIDILRGIVMVLMALDHVREYFTNARYDPLDLSRTDAFLFMTRWITHFCAPVFIFLAGTGAFISLSRGKTKKELSKFLLIRGIWLIILELTIIRFFWQFNFDYTLLFAQVIWAIGWSMIVMSLLVYFSIKAVALFGIVLIFFHNFLDGISPAQAGIFGWPWIIIHHGGSINIYGYDLLVLYPLIPWVGVMAAGYSFGSLIIKEEQERKKICIRLGVGLITTFFVIRAANIYGDPHPWAIQDSFGKTILSFISLEKYPPSLLYLLITLGPAILSLAYLDKMKGWIRKFFVTFGKVPLFYYLLHIPLVHLAAVIVTIITGVPNSFMFANDPPWFWPQHWGFDVAIVYIFWIVIVLSLYPVSLWFAKLKQRRHDWWLSYF